ncbi:ABC-2 family transporter protein [Candidatus Woesearchaeota archaeon]|nr:ABC-2 family transporter protein [Candidatus Woesearchaeota archaeon]
MNQYFKVFWRNLILEISREMAYKTNFLIKCLAILVIDMVPPLVAMLIYKTTPGIPGWGFEEFLLFQGVLIFVLGLNESLFMRMLNIVVEAVKSGTFDMTLVKPFPPLVYITFGSINLNGFAGILVGASVIAYSIWKIGISLLSLNFMVFLLMVLLAIIFQYGIVILICAFAFLFVKSHALYDIYSSIMNFARYPLSIYDSSLSFLLTFIFPIAVSSHYPAEALLKGLSLKWIVGVTLPVTIFFILCLLCWRYAMKKYSSVGG